MATAGVAVKVLTGDNELVARHVFAEIGVPVTGVLTGDALTHLSDEALRTVRTIIELRASHASE